MATNLSLAFLETIPAHEIPCFSRLKWKLCNRAAAIFACPISRKHFSLAPPDRGSLPAFLLLKAINAR